MSIAANGLSSVSERQLFLAAPIGILAIVFAGFVGTAIALRRRSDLHKRLMLLATLSLLAQPLARVVSDSNALLLVYLCVLTCVAMDTFRNLRLNPAFTWGAPLIIATFQMAYLGMLTQTWMQSARWLVS